ncbi:penicillin-binding protein activator [Marinobacter nauticus]
MKKPSCPPTIPAMLLLLSLVLSGCATTDLGSHKANSPAQALSLAADEENRALAQSYLLRTANLFQDQGNHADARTLLRNNQLVSLSPELKKQWQLLAMASAVALEDKRWASDLAKQLEPDGFLAYPDELMARAARLQSQTFALAGQHLDAAKSLILLGQLKSSIQPQPLHDQIWGYFKDLDTTELQAATKTATGFEIQGWLELATALQDRDASLDVQGRKVRQWQNNWPSHPAAQVPPTELRLLAELALTRPENIVLALPFEGRLASAGQAIRDGFLAAYYTDDTADRDKTDIRILDTSGRSFSELYQELGNTQADLVIGPLDKQALGELSRMNTLPIPVLGLNYLPEKSRIPDGLHQFGLSAEDEARQIAERLANQQIQHVLVLIPHGDWGDRVEAALLGRMAKLGVDALDIVRFMPDENLRSVTADLLGITTSRNRAIQVERTIGLDVEFEPRRRQDAEGIVMVASPTIARQLNPLFAFYYGGDLPVYSPSIIYEGTPNASRDRDLNQVNFTDIPWVLEPELALRNEASKHFSNTQGQLGRLFAMGADAWQISKRLPLLRQIEDASIDGLTGTLTMDPDGSIHRHQLWASFRNGEAVLTEMPDTTEEKKGNTAP